jgi:hypothetical protein
MKKIFILLSVMIVAVLLMGAPPPPAKANPTVTIDFLNPPPGKLLELGVGESYTFEIQVTSDEPFVIAMAMTDAYYPGRGVFWHGGDRAVHTNSALLHLTMTGKSSTADLSAVCDWPEPGGDCWPEGVAPASIAIGARFQGGLTVAEIFTFAVVVP